MLVCARALLSALVSLGDRATGLEAPAVSSPYDGTVCRVPQRLSFLFNLSDVTVVDATRKGNKTKVRLRRPSFGCEV